MIPAQDAFARRNMRFLNRRARTPPGLQRHLGWSPSRFAVFVEGTTTTTVVEETTNGGDASSISSTSVQASLSNDEDICPSMPPTPVESEDKDDDDDDDEDDDDDDDEDEDDEDDDDEDESDDDELSSSSSSDEDDEDDGPTTTAPSPNDQDITSTTHWYARLAANAERAGMSTQAYHDLLAWESSLRLERLRVDYEVALERLAELRARWAAARQFLNIVRAERDSVSNSPEWFAAAVRAELVRSAVQRGAFEGFAYERFAYERFGFPPVREGRTERLAALTGRTQSRFFRKEVGEDGKVTHRRL